jgi:hypothetical protein
MHGHMNVKLQNALLFAMQNGYQASHNVTLYVICLSSARCTFSSDNFSATYSHVKLDMHSEKRIISGHMSVRFVIF